jgi:hypothetical protein
MRKSAWRIIAALLLVGTCAPGWAAPYIPLLIGDSEFDPKCAEPAAVKEARAALAAAIATTRRTAVASTSATATATVTTTTSPTGSTISPDRNYYVVQFQGPVKAAWRQQCRQMGAVFVDYVPRYAFTTRMTATQAAQVAALPFVRWVGPFPAKWKYRPYLVRQPQHALTVVVSLFPGERTDRVNQFIKSRNLWFLGQGLLPRPVIRTRMAEAAIPDLAALPEVSWIQEYHPPTLRNDQGRRWLNISNVAGLPSGVNVWRDYGLFGRGQIVGIADTGLDTGNTGDLHPDFLGPDGQPRLVAAFALGRSGDWSDSLIPTPESNPAGHGTHVAGSVLGNGAMSGSDPATATYSEQSFAGGAPEARLVFQSVMDAAGYLSGIPLTLTDLFRQSYNAGARIHTNSWGGGYYGEYDYSSADVDYFMWQYPEMTILFAAGNDGYDADGDGVIDPGSVTPPATAKNCITVGAGESYRPPFSGWDGYANYPWGLFGYFANPIASDYISDNPSGMAAFSSRGPCIDGRIKPDIVAPGTDIISTRSRGRLGDHRGVSEAWGVYNDWYLYAGGTSMATPLTAGAATLVRQYYEQTRGFHAPSGALIKATMINGAFDMTPGQYGTGEHQEIHPRPDQSQGWGRGNVGPSIHPERAHAASRLTFYDYGMISDSGVSDIIPVTVSDGSAPVQITLAWSDAPAVPYTYSALVDDLDLTVRDPRGTVYRGNYGTRAFADRVNNVEHVDVPAPVAGTYYITVYGYNVPMAPQSYSLVITAATAETTYSVSGSVTTSGGDPVRGVAIAVEGINTTPGRRVSTATRDDGTYEVRNLTPGRYRITPSKQYYQFNPTEQRVEVAAANVANVNFSALEHVTYEIGGYVFDPSGRAVPGITINAMVLPNGLRYQATTNAKGHYRIANLEPGDYRIEPVQVLDHFIWPDEAMITLPSAESSSENFYISDVWYSMLDVYSLNSSTQPIPSAQVTLERYDFDLGDFVVAQQRQTNSQGFVRLGGQELVNGQTLQILREGYYRIHVTKAGYTFEPTLFDDHVEGYLPPNGPYIDVWTATVGTFYFYGGSPAPTYSASGLIRTQWDRGVADVPVTLTGVVTGAIFRTRTGLNGFYRQAGMPADVYRVTAAKPGWQLIPIEPVTGQPDPAWEAIIKVGPPAYTPPISLAYLYSDPWSLGFMERDFDYQYPNGRQDYWAVKLAQ